MLSCLAVYNPLSLTYSLESSPESCSLFPVSTAYKSIAALLVNQSLTIAEERNRRTSQRSGRFFAHKEEEEKAR